MVKEQEEEVREDLSDEEEERDIMEDFTVRN